MTTLVTGATGFVGSHIVRLLAKRGEPVRVLVRPESRTDALEGLACEQVTGDLCDPNSLDAALQGVRRVFHVAADYRLWARDPEEIYSSNVTGTRNLLITARDARVEQFIYTSTVATIAVPTEDGSLADESTPASLEQMIGHYKRSKFIAEREALAFAQDGMPVIVVNPTTPVGPGDWKPTPTGRIVVDFLNGRMPAFVDTGLNLVAVEDVAEGHLLAAERGKPGERYLLGGQNMTLEEILAELARITGRRAPRVRIPHGVALAAAYVDTALCRMLRREPHIPC
jgi:dihydroflavonol-4-reductase